MTSSKSSSLRDRFIAETNAFLNCVLVNRGAQQHESKRGTGQIGTLITVPGNADGRIDDASSRVLRHRLERVLDCRDTDVLLDLDGVRLSDRTLKEIVCEFEEKFARAGRNLVVLGA